MPKAANQRFPTGTSVYKKFDFHGWFTGTVSSYVPDQGGYYRIDYEDGDCEDVASKDVVKLVQNYEELVRNSKTQASVLELATTDENAQNRQTNDKKRPLDDTNEPRRSGRAKTSTLTYVGGIPVKKANNYLVKGMTYVYNPDVMQPNKKKEAAKKKKNQAPSKPPKKPRVVPTHEAERLQFKACVQKRLVEKAAVRVGFLQKHMSALQPFMDPPVLRRLQQATSKDVATEETHMQPDAIQADLRDYQLQGLDWMSRMYQHNMGMILGDEMGLGKTLQTISLICHLKESFDVSGPSLVVCPLSVLYSWCDEISKWAPSLKFLRFHSSSPESLEQNVMGPYDVIITTYEMVSSPSLANIWSRQFFNLLVLDEGHRIKSLKTNISACVRKVHCETRLILTGTPLANNLVELYSLLNFLAPDVFTTDVPFAKAFDLTLNLVDPVKLQEAHTLLKVFMLRRLKDQVEKLMPKKIETKVICPLSKMQLWWYKAILLKDISLVTNESGNSKLLNNLIMQLRKACIHPFMFPGAENPDIETSLPDLVGSSGKLAVLDLLLRRLYEKGHRVVLFSQFTQVLDIIDDYCLMRGWNYCRFDGGTARAKRNYVINSFNKPDSKKFLFLMSTRSGGMGINLQTADTCILFDSDWNPQPDIQAMARVHRIGQKKTVHVYRLVTKGTVEERMIERAEKKLYLDRMVTQDGTGADLDNNDESENSNKLLSTIRFGCNAVFGQHQKMVLPSAEDIDLITDRERSQDFSSGNLQGGAESNVDDFDATTEFTATTNFGGIDFGAVREKHRKDKMKSMDDIKAAWMKRQRKNRIKLVASDGSGYGAPVPVLVANDYDLEHGERSVFDQELAHSKSKSGPKKKSKPSFEWQDFCQLCGDGGLLVQCPYCPISLHLSCAGVKNPKHFMRCLHHQCAECGKTPSAAGGFMFPCTACCHAYCEDHRPEESIVLEDGCCRMEKLGFSDPRNGHYIICSAQCQAVAREDGWAPPEEQPPPPCPPALDLGSHFGDEINDKVSPPETSLDQQSHSSRLGKTTEEQKPLANIHPSGPPAAGCEPDRPAIESQRDLPLSSHLPSQNSAQEKVVARQGAIGRKPADFVGTASCDSLPVAFESEKDYSSVLPTESTEKLISHMYSLATNWAVEERMHGKNVFYWDILSDKAMKAIAAEVPMSTDELVQIGVVGEDMMEKYGDMIVKAITSFVEQEGLHQHIQRRRDTPNGGSRQGDEQNVHPKEVVLLDL